MTSVFEPNIKNYVRTFCKQKNSDQELITKCKCEANGIISMHKALNKASASETISFYYDRCIQEKALFSGQTSFQEDSNNHIQNHNI